MLRPKLVHHTTLQLNVTFCRTLSSTDLGGMECQNTESQGDEDSEAQVQQPLLPKPGVNKKPKKFKIVWHGFWGILKLSGRVNQASLKLSAGFSNTVC